ncbi:cytochrome B [Microbulbifer agarilyticus]|uniref:Cytochrome B n=1 Tax=Microbulbifer agarilyticus TaxID=260552 RepID=A0A1Q2M2K7_9GAMM|nr:cytochrome b/b6 domain-containing protein [Microbulbifer agarilyticus]AQQ66954.1 cytochrome B [Microbulbifer agarilyticus]
MASTPNSWSKALKTLHWMIAFFILFAWASVELHEQYEKGSYMRGWWMVLHFSLGFLVLFLGLFRLYYRATHGRPNLYGGSFQKPVSLLTQSLMYVLIIGMPLTGLLMRQFAGRDTTLFWLFELPAFFEKNIDVAKQFAFLHKELLWNALLVLLVLHIGGALWHHFYNKDNTLRQMLPFGKVK